MFSGLIGTSIITTIVAAVFYLTVAPQPEPQPAYAKAPGFRQVVLFGAE